MSRENGQRMKDYLCMIAGTALMAFAVSSVFDPAGLVTGGFSGLAIVVKNLTEPLIPGGIPIWVTNLLLNIPLFFFEVRIRGMAYLKRTLFGTLMNTVWLAVIPVYELIPDDRFLSALFGGVLMGIGIGLVFVGRGTTGGTDTLAAMLQRRFRHYSIAQILQIIDWLIVFTGVFTFGIHASLYAVVAIFVTAKVTDMLVEGMNYAKAAFIITNDPERVAKELMEKLDRGATGIHVRGMYTNEERMMIFCVVGNKQVAQLKESVGTLDPSAFVIVSDAREVLGEGFQTDFS